MDLNIALGFKDDKEYFTLNEAGNRVEIDMYPKEEKQAMSPMELLLSGVIACAAVDIVSMIKKKRKTVNDLKGNVGGNRADTFPKKFTEIHIHYDIYSPDLTEDEAGKVIDLAVEKYCSVAATLDPAVQVTHGFSVIR